MPELIVKKFLKFYKKLKILSEDLNINYKLKCLIKNMKNIIVTAYAKEQMEKEGITRRQIFNVIRYPADMKKIGEKHVLRGMVNGVRISIMCSFSFAGGKVLRAKKGWGLF